MKHDDSMTTLNFPTWSLDYAIFGLIIKYWEGEKQFWVEEYDTNISDLNNFNYNTLNLWKSFYSNSFNIQQGEHQKTSVWSYGSIIKFDFSI